MTVVYRVRDPKCNLNLGFRTLYYTFRKIHGYQNIILYLFHWLNFQNEHEPESTHCTILAFGVRNRETNEVKPVEVCIGPNNQVNIRLVSSNGNISKLDIVRM